MIRRALSSSILAALVDTPAIFLHGARQTGKTTLVRKLAESGHPAAYLSLDRSRVLEAAKADPEGFVSRLATPVILDEVQLEPALFRALKVEIDRDRRPGRFLLTGSAHLLILPRLSESLAGRMEILTLWPLSQTELEGRPGDAVDLLWDDAPLPAGDLEAGDDLIERLVRGGYPEVVHRPSAARRRAWFDAYLTTLLQRDVRDLANIDGLIALPGLLRLLAARATALLNATELSRASGLAQTTLRRYLGLLEGIFLMQRIPAWSTNLSKRVVRSPKTAIIDSGLHCHLLGLDAKRLTADRKLLGSVLENFVVQELTRLASWSEVRPRLFHYRTHAGQETDVILEDSSGSVVGVEVKARATVRARDFRTLRVLADGLGERFRRGVVLYTGSTAIPFGERLHALPVSWLWRAA
jgi:predicted AAA+ superfamily ATPase